MNKSGLALGIVLITMAACQPSPLSPTAVPLPTPSLGFYLAKSREVLWKMADDGKAIRECFDSEHEATNQFLDLSEEDWWKINDYFALRYMTLYDELLMDLSQLSVPLEARSFHDEFAACVQHSRTVMAEPRQAVAERSDRRLLDDMANGLRLEERCVTRAYEDWYRLSERSLGAATSARPADSATLSTAPSA